MQFQFLDIVLSLGIVQGLFLAFALLRFKDTNKKANYVLAEILIISAFVLAGRMIVAHKFAFHIFKWFSFTDVIIFLFGPLNYLYVRRLIVKDGGDYKLALLHYLPALIYAVIFLGLNVISREFRRELYQNGGLFVLYNSFELIGLSLNAYYLVRAFKLLKAYRLEEKNKLSSTQSFHRFLSVYLLVIFAFLTFWLVSYINSYYLRDKRLVFVSYDLIWIAIPFFIYVVGYFSLKQPELFRIVPELPSKPKQKRLNEEESSVLKKNLEDLIDKEGIHLKSDLTLSELASNLEVSTNDLSWLLNNEYESSFYEFINQRRVDAFLEKVAVNEHAKQTILGIALDVGFKSKSTFNKAFKTKKGLTPSEYIKTL